MGADGDAGTKLFNAYAIVRHSKNTISTILDDNNALLTHHDHKANLIWDYFKQGLGVSEFEGMLFDLYDLLPPLIDLSVLEADFSKEEIDGTISEFPTDKSPGPDSSGFFRHL